jgi:hypothetical protein
MNNVNNQILQHSVGVSGANVPFFACFKQHIGLEQIMGIDIGRVSKFDRIGRMLFF